MQSKTLLQRTGCPGPIFKDWLRRGVILPAKPGRGAGTHADYDEANAVALMVGVRMKQAGIVVGNYVEAFVVLQLWLRKISSLEWQGYVVTMTPEGANIHRAKRIPELNDMALIVPLAPVCQILSKSVEDPGFYQYSLLGLQSVRRAK